MQTKILLITPTLAAKYLERNISNRPLNTETVSIYVRDMINGDFRFTGDTIKFDKDGILLDGQHRLQAIIRSGLSQEMIVVEGLNKDSFLYMDIGKKRGCPDALAINGYKNTARLASALRMLFLVREYVHFPITQVKSHNRISNRQLLELLEDNKDLADLADEAGKFRHLNRTIGSGVLGLFLDAFRRDPHQVLDFLYKYDHGTELYEHHPVLTLRNYLLRESTGPRRIPIGTKFFLLATAWNDCGKKHPLRKNIILPMYSPEVTIPIIT